METHSSNERPKVPWHSAGTPKGIFVISLVLVTIAALFFAIIFRRFIFPRWFGAVAGTMSLFISAGMALRINMARFMLILLLWFGLLFDAVSVCKFTFGLSEGRLPVVPTAGRIAVLVGTLSYLLRRDVRHAFDPPTQPSGQTDTCSNEPVAPTSNISTSHVTDREHATIGRTARLNFP